MFNPNLEDQLALYYRAMVGRPGLPVAVTAANDDEVLAAIEEAHPRQAMFGGDDHFWAVLVEDAVVGYYAVNPFVSGAARIIFLNTNYTAEEVVHQLIAH